MSTATIIAIVIGSFYGLDRIGILERLGIVRPSASVAATELEISDRALERAKARIHELEATRSLEPILAQITAVSQQIGANAQIQSDVLDRLVHHNGSFAAMEKSLGHVEHSLGLLSGFIVGIAPPSTNSQ